jgi:3-deoxy-manno-octulosonate cytidylyltransferase (CMP-KDO synthetase)
MKNKIEKVIGLIPSRLRSKRLPMKALLPINGVPLVIHTYRRAKMSKILDELLICCDDKKIANISKKNKAKFIMTSVHHNNGTERIFEAYLKLKVKAKLIIDIQGDEPLISPHHIDEVAKFHLKNLDADIILPVLKIKNTNNTNIVKIVTDKKNNVLYLSRAGIPYEFKSKSKYLKKHLSIVSFKPEALEKFAKHKKTNLEKIEDIELLRALEIGLKIKTLELEGDSFSVDVVEDYEKAKNIMKKDKIFKKYNDN